MKTAHLSPFSYWSERFFIFFWQPRTQEVYACCDRPIKMELLLWRGDVLIRFFCVCVCHTLVLRRDLLRCYSYTEAGKIKRKKREFTLTHRVFSPPVSSLRAFFSSYRCSPLLSAYRYVTSWTALSFLFSSPSKHLFVCLFSFNTQRAHLYVQNQLRSLCISNVSQLHFFFLEDYLHLWFYLFSHFFPLVVPAALVFNTSSVPAFFFYRFISGWRSLCSRPSSFPLPLYLFCQNWAEKWSRISRAEKGEEEKRNWRSKKKKKNRYVSPTFFEYVSQKLATHPTKVALFFFSPHYALSASLFFFWSSIKRSVCLYENKPNSINSSLVYFFVCLLV